MRCIILGHGTMVWSSLCRPPDAFMDVTVEWLKGELAPVCQSILLQETGSRSFKEILKMSTHVGRDISDITKTAIGHCWSNKPIPNCHIDPYCGRYFQPRLSHHRWRGRRLAKLKCHVCGANGPGLVLTTLLSNIKTRFRQDVHQS